MTLFDWIDMDICDLTLFSAEDICQKLSVSRSTLDRWRRINNDVQSPFAGGDGFQTKVMTGLRSTVDVENETVGLTRFPEPTLHVGGNPRWSSQDINSWLLANKDKKNRRGFL